MSKFDLAKDPKTDPVVLDELSYEDPNVRCWVAQNPNTPPETLDRLSYDENPYVRQRVALNPNTSPEALERLSIDLNWDVRWGVSWNPNITPELLEYYYIISSGKFWNSTRNPNTPQYILDLHKFKGYLKYYG